MDKFMKSLKITPILVLLIFIACSKQEFSTQKSAVSYSSPAVISVSQTSCAGTKGSTVKPLVDFIFLWDNSSSVEQISSTTRYSLNNLINNISSQFDYRIIMTPLIASGNTQSFLVASSTDGLSADALKMVVPQGSAATLLGSFPKSTATAELGVYRVKELLNTNAQNGILRQKANTIVVIMSNGDDQSPEMYKNFNMSDITDHILTSIHQEWARIKADEIKSIATATVKSSQFRFMSLVPFTVCGPQYRANIVYREISNYLYGAADSTDICKNNISSFFDNINNSLHQVDVVHKFSYWKVADPTVQPIDPSSLRVVTNTGKVIPESETNGYTFSNKVETVYLESFPVPAQLVTGYVIKLNGDAVLSTPDCIAVSYNSATQYFGYIKLNGNPVVSTIKVQINGRTIANSDTNGWSYYDYHDNQNVAIVSPTDYTAGVPAVVESGYFIKLNGDAVMRNGDVSAISYDPCAVESCK